MSGEDPVSKLGDREESDEAELNESLEELLAAVVVATDTGDTNRLLHMAFRLLPSKNVSNSVYFITKCSVPSTTEKMTPYFKSESETDESSFLSLKSAFCHSVLSLARLNIWILYPFLY